MKQVIRIEHNDGKGWFNTKSVDITSHSNYNEISERHTEGDFPSYWDDKILIKQLPPSLLEHFHFAFNSLEQLRNGFTDEELKEAVGMGFKILSLTVEDYFESPYQVIFRKESIIEMQDISFMFL